MGWGGGQALSRWSSARHPLVCAAFLSRARLYPGVLLAKGQQCHLRVLGAVWPLTRFLQTTSNPRPGLAPHGSDGSPLLCIPEAQGDRLDLPNLPRNSEQAALQEGVFREGLSTGWGRYTGIESWGWSPGGGVLGSGPWGGVWGSAPRG